MTKLNILLSVFLVLLLNVTVVSAQGKSGNAPGQQKKQAVVGEVETVTGNSVVVEEKKGNKKTEALIDKTTKVVGQDRKLLNLGSIKPKDKIAIISTDSGSPATDSGKKKAIRVFVKSASASAQLKRRAVQGVITALNGSIITLAHQIHRDRVYTVFASPSTEIKIKGIEGGSLADLQVGQRIAAVGDLVEGGILAKRIHVIPGKGAGVFKKNPVSTSSASPTSTASASPTASASATPVSTASASPAP